MRCHLALLYLLFISTHGFGADLFANTGNAIDRGRNALDLQTLAPLVAAGNTSAQYRLGVLYYLGHGVPEDEKLAILLWKKAAAKGSTDAMYQLASAYLFGNQARKTVPDPYREAATWYFQAACAEHAESQYYLGLLFLAGKGVAQSRTEATRWMRKAAERGHAEATKALTRMESGK